MSVRDNLIAARALIDSPQKFKLIEAAVGAVDAVTKPDSLERAEVMQALADSYKRMKPTDWSDWASVMDRFNQAIEAAGDK